MQDSIYEVRRYNYGGGGHQTSVRKIGPAKLMNDSLDGEQYNKVKSELEVLKSKYGERRDRVKAIIAKREQITRRERELENDMVRQFFACNAFQKPLAEKHYPLSREPRRRKRRTFNSTYWNGRRENWHSVSVST